MDKDGGMTKYAVLPNEEHEIEVTTGVFKGQRGIVKQSSAGMLKVRLASGSEVEVSETSCKTTR